MDRIPIQRAVISVSDIAMPDEDGYLLIRSIRTLAADEKKNLPAIALTASSRNEDRTRALVEGFNLHIAKPGPGQFGDRSPTTLHGLESYFDAAVARLEQQYVLEGGRSAIDPQIAVMDAD